MLTDALLVDLDELLGRGAHNLKVTELQEEHVRRRIDHAQLAVDVHGRCTLELARHALRTERSRERLSQNARAPAPATGPPE
jgi:hypothetical protein